MWHFVIGLCALLALGSRAAACELPSPSDLSKTTFVKPIEVDVSSGFGPMLHPVLRYVRLHNGIDFEAPAGEAIVATLGGRVVEARYRGEYGNRIMIDHGGGIVSSYSHLSRWASDIAAEKCVRPGDVIGFVGNTGISAGPHLHFEIHHNLRPIDPAPLLGVKAPAPDHPLPPSKRN